jgi:hypothetical protein
MHRVSRRNDPDGDRGRVLESRSIIRPMPAARYGGTIKRVLPLLGERFFSYTAIPIYRSILPQLSGHSSLVVNLR